MAEARVYMRIPVLSRFGDRCLFLQYLARQEARSESICSEITTKLQWRSRLAEGENQLNLYLYKEMH